MAEQRKRTAPTRAPRTGDGSPWAVRRRRPRDHDVKRDAVVKAAAQEFNARGYHNTSLDDIASALGVTKPTIYYYVANKEQLLFECFREGLQRIREVVIATERSDRPARERLETVVRGYAEAVASEYGWCMVRAHEHDLGNDLGKQINSLKSEIDQGIRRLLRAGVADGSIGPCDPKIAAFAMAGALNWIAHWYRENQPLTAAEVGDAFVTFFGNGLLPRPARTVATRA